MSVWTKDQATCNHEGSERFFDVKDGFRIGWCGDCGGETSRVPDPNQLTGQSRRDDLDTYFKEYANEQKAAGGNAILSYKGWIEAGRPTFAERRAEFNKPKPQTPEGDNEMTKTTTTNTTTKKEKAPRPAGAKALVREIFTKDPNAEFTIEELAQKTGKGVPSITTAISDLKSTKYSKPGEPLKLHRHKNGKFSLKEPVVEEAAPKNEAPTTPQTTVTSDAPAAQGEALPVA